MRQEGIFKHWLKKGHSCAKKEVIKLMTSNCRYNLLTPHRKVVHIQLICNNVEHNQSEYPRTSCFHGSR